MNKMYYLIKKEAYAPIEPTDSEPIAFCYDFDAIVSKQEVARFDRFDFALRYIDKHRHSLKEGEGFSVIRPMFDTNGEIEDYLLIYLYDERNAQFDKYLPLLKQSIHSVDILSAKLGIPSDRLTRAFEQGVSMASLTNTELYTLKSYVTNA